MPMLQVALLLHASATLTSAWTPPTYEGFDLVWSESFSGNESGQLPSQGTWDIIDKNLGLNNELETYCASAENVQLSGKGTLQIVPWRNSSVQNGWTSGRIESWHAFTPEPGRRTVAEAYIRFGSNPTDTKKGMWPAFWVLGNSSRQGTKWPGCGELDVLEMVNGVLLGHGTAHCDISPHGICNETTGLTSKAPVPNQDWRLWRIIWDRAVDTNDWRSENITWYANSEQFHVITGDRIGDSEVWTTLAHALVFFILNVAVGGAWPGDPNSTTADGYGSMMEVGYVALYVSQ
ncbi:concanavalin A-like lectin/glucanase domain-containing protein [Podospora aff. communis PSN243]|uniref:Concanavalin A-like lectin/glucanase domain-containing protein n=1 Tax=Podospora aff. communis PSN243 TaxID=3040156 RepID=A0AAV9GJT7_9PEZI|nr:concanavalin A-like lectin/glucanase domain-containing protein [Podospora aff. communis PSN243]